MHLFLIRHGESTNNALDDAAQRVADPPLTDRGRQQARRLAADFPEAQIPAEVGDDGWWRGGPESVAAGYGRAIHVVQTLRRWARQDAAAGRPPRRVAVVSHGDFMSALVKAVADNLPSDGVTYEHRNTGITRFRLDDGMCRVLYVNRFEHLEEEGT